MQVEFTDVDGAVAAVVSVVTVVVVERPDGKSRMSDGDEGIRNLLLAAAKLLDVIPEPIAAETTLQTLQAQQADLIARMDAAEKVQALQDEEATKVRELCSLSRRQDYFDAPLSVLVQCQLRQAAVDALAPLRDMVIDVDGPLNWWRNNSK